MKTEAGYFHVAVCGAHMSELPLNPQLLSLNAELVVKTRTAPKYKLYKLAGFTPARPGLVRINTGGSSIEIEVWKIPSDKYGTFVAGIPAPLGIGTLELADGNLVQGFICETYAVMEAVDISYLGGWKAYLAQSVFT